MKRYRLFIDETGDHTLSSSEDLGKRYLGVVGVAFEKNASAAFEIRLEALKREHIPNYDPNKSPILHRKEMVQRRSAFSFLEDDACQARWNADLLKLLRGSHFRIFGVVVDKQAHAVAEHRSVGHPYHYAMDAMLERYCGWLAMRGFVGDVMAEARGGVEDLALAAAYEDARRGSGTKYQTNERKRSLEDSPLLVRRKSLNIGGLQLADVLAHPITRDVLAANGRCGPVEGFGRLLLDAVRENYNRKEGIGRIEGYGRVLLK